MKNNTRPQKIERAANWIAVVVLFFWTISPAILAQDVALKPEPSWKIPSDNQIKVSFERWLNEIHATEGDRQSVLALLDEQINNRKNVATIDLVVEAIGQLRPDVRHFAENLSARPGDIDATNLESFGDQGLVVDHLRLLVARHFVQNEMYDEAIDQFDQLSLSLVLDPASLLFYKSIAQHQLIQKQACLESAQKLLENETELPLRYAMLSKLMVADIQPLQEDSLDEIARLMNDIRRRQKLYRAGMRVRGEEEEVIRKLDKLIEQIQQHRQNMQQQQQSSPQDSAQKPLDESRVAGGQGEGKTNTKSLSEGGDWGDLPQQDRAAALAEMGKDLPPHYRAVIEEYFRKLADEQDK
jgi:hypothetical protein